MQSDATETPHHFEMVLESEVRKIVYENQVDQILHQTCRELKEQAQNSFHNHTGSYSFNLVNLKLLIMRHTPSYQAEYMPLPYVFHKRRELFINVDNSLHSFYSEKLSSAQEKLKSVQDMNYSFLFSVAAGIRNAKYCPDSMKKYRKIVKRINMDGINMPMTIDQLPRFERQNPNLEIYVFGFKDTGVNESSRPDLFLTNSPEDNERTRCRKSMARSIARDQVISQFSFPLYVSFNTRTDSNICEDRNRQGALRTEILERSPYD
ncbi:unnamed protein product [Allacma fusca]|uniref:Uncharacterized protein n=1 Tax=Allacma fusca TaxID=39272 RepID=A0A8J2P860_9HEXA|nr:unnamed protein product [Allacma fusca]